MGNGEKEDYISKFFNGAKQEILANESLSDFQKEVAVFSLSLKEHQMRDPDYWLELIRYTENLREKGQFKELTPKEKKDLTLQKKFLSKLLHFKK
ncbi:MAG: hypothetical protein H6625_04720 [Bdellovibrionaceae bacterium]|nr:hypothetical protein [Pseudobdellovibrionaceae bacterium]